MKFIDTHIHLQDIKSTAAKNILQNMHSLGIVKLINMSSTKNDWQGNASLAERFANTVIPAFGIHPWYVSGHSADDLPVLDSFLQKYPVAIVGEIGLDGAKSDIKKQCEMFFAQTDIAKRHHRPASIHCIRAAEKIQNNWSKLPEKFVFHSYSGKKEFLRQIINHGGYVGFGASIFRNPNAEEILNFAPIERILLETDAPYQGFEPKKENSPENIIKIAHKIAEIRKENLEIFCEQIYKNSREFIK